MVKFILVKVRYAQVTCKVIVVNSHNLVLYMTNKTTPIIVNVLGKIK